MTAACGRTANAVADPRRIPASSVVGGPQRMRLGPPRPFVSADAPRAYGARDAAASGRPRAARVSTTARDGCTTKLDSLPTVWHFKNPRAETGAGCGNRAIAQVA